MDRWRTRRPDRQARPREHAASYAYSGSKRELFDRVVTDEVVRFHHDVQLDPDDVPAFAGVTFDSSPTTRRSSGSARGIHSSRRRRTSRSRLIPFAMPR
jgi:hypothetical protein